MRTINQTYQDEYKRKKRRKLALLFAGYFLILGGIAFGIFYVLFLSKWMAITNVKVEQKSFVNDDAIRQVVEKYLGGKVFFIKRSNNIFLTKTNQIKTLVEEHFPILKDIQVSKRYFHGLLVQANFRKGTGIWCFKKRSKPIEIPPGEISMGECFYFDQDGIAYDRAADSSGTLLLIVYDEIGLLAKLGRPVADPERLNWLFQLQKEMSRAKVGIARLVIPEELYRVNIKTTEGWEIYLSTTDLLSPQIKALTIFLANKISVEQRSQLQYIDIRIPQRVYYKFSK